MRLSSVATTTEIWASDWATRLYTRSTIGTPATEARGLPGNRLEPCLAGMTAKMFMSEWSQIGH